MNEFSGHVVSEAVRVADASETTADLLAGDTVIEVARIGDFVEGTHVRIDGNVYAYDDSLTDDGRESGIPSITIDAPGLVADVAEGTAVESWNPNANGGNGDVISEWKAQVAADADSEERGMPATLHHTLIPTLPSDMPLQVGDAVTVRIENDDSWLIVDVLGATYALDPGYIATGTLAATTEISAGDPDGQRVVMNGIDGAFEAYNAANEQTVNIDGEANYMEGTLATSASGPRVEIGPGLSLGDPVDEVRLYTDEADELSPAYVRVRSDDPDPGVTEGSLEIRPPEWDGAAGVRPSLEMTSGRSDGLGDTYVSLGADNILLTGEVGVAGGTLDATMGTGSVGTGTFRDSVDARVPEVLADYGHIERSADGTQSITTGGSAQLVLWQTSAVAARGGISYSAGTFTIGTAGTYMISAYVGIAANTTGRRLVSIRKNTTGKATTNLSASSAGAWSTTVSQILDCAASDTLDVVAFQDSGGSLVLSSGSYITIHRVA